MYPDIAQRDRRTAILKISAILSSACKRTPQAPSIYRMGATRALIPSKRAIRVISAFFRDKQALIQQLPKLVFIPFCFQRDTWQIKADHSQIIPAIVDLLTLLLIHAEEATAAHWRFKGASDLNHLIIIKNIWIHALGCALQRQLFDIVVSIAKFVVQAIADSKYQFWEYRRFTVLPKPAIRLRKIACWIMRDCQLVPKPKPKVTKGVWPFAVCSVLTSYSSDWKAS